MEPYLQASQAASVLAYALPKLALPALSALKDAAYRMMRQATDLTIGIELINDKAWMGGTIYLSNLAQCISRLPLHERPKVRLLGDPVMVSNVQKAIALHAGTITQDITSSSRRHLIGFSFRGSFRTLLSRLFRRHMGAVDILYPGFGLYIPGAKIVRWIPDFQHRYLPNFFSADEIRARDESIGKVASKEGIVILSSQVALCDFRLFFPDSIATPRVWPFHSLINLSQWTATEEFHSPHELPEKYIYLPNQFWTHKNHKLVFTALNLLRHEHGIKIQLVCTGLPSDSRAKDHYNNLLDFLRRNDLQDQVKLLGLLPRDQQIFVFRNCAAVVQPSLFEGWSTVVEDARAIGRPIFISDIPVHREQMPDCQYFFDPHSPEDLARLLAIHWHHLSPGPDLEAEAAAQALTEMLIQSSARTFVSYCLEARRI